MVTAVLFLVRPLFEVAASSRDDIFGGGAGAGRCGTLLMTGANAGRLGTVSATTFGCGSSWIWRTGADGLDLLNVGGGSFS